MADFIVGDNCVGEVSDALLRPVRNVENLVDGVENNGWRQQKEDTLVRPQKRSYDI